jgi:hypothetical protein
MINHTTDSILRNSPTRQNNGNFQVDASRATTVIGNYRVFTKQNVVFGNLRHRVRVGEDKRGFVQRSTWRDTPPALGGGENSDRTNRL